MRNLPLKKIPTIDNLFPATVRVTQEILSTADRYDTTACIGALTLRKALRGHYDDARIFWGNGSGYLRVEQDGHMTEILVYSDYKMMDITKPTTVILTIK
jgi:hypothetical protein